MNIPVHKNSTSNFCLKITLRVMNRGSLFGTFSPSVSPEYELHSSKIVANNHSLMFYFINLPYLNIPKNSAPFPNSQKFLQLWGNLKPLYIVTINVPSFPKFLQIWGNFLPKIDVFVQLIDIFYLELFKLNIFQILYYILTCHKYYSLVVYI